MQKFQKLLQPIMLIFLGLFNLILYFANAVVSTTSGDGASANSLVSLDNFSTFSQIWFTVLSFALQFVLILTILYGVFLLLKNIKTLKFEALNKINFKLITQITYYVIAALSVFILVLNTGIVKDNNIIYTLVMGSNTLMLEYALGAALIVVCVTSILFAVSNIFIEKYFMPLQFAEVVKESKENLTKEKTTTETATEIEVKEEAVKSEQPKSKAKKEAKAKVAEPEIVIPDVEPEKEKPKEVKTVKSSIDDEDDYVPKAIDRVVEPKKTDSMLFDEDVVNTDDTVKTKPKKKGWFFGRK